MDVQSTSDGEYDGLDFPEFTTEDLAQIDATVAAALSSNNTFHNAHSKLAARSQSLSTLPEILDIEQSLDEQPGEESTKVEASQQELLITVEPQGKEDSISIELEVAPSLSAEQSNGEPIQVEQEDDSINIDLRESSSSSSPPATPDLPRQSLFDTFRPWNAFSVTDLTAPVWCEVQYEYGLLGKRHLSVEQRPESIMSSKGKEIQVRKELAKVSEGIMKGGQDVHKRLEEEIHGVKIHVPTRSVEERMGLKLVDMLVNLQALTLLGCCREMPVMGFIDGHFIRGIIDEITLEPTITTLPPPTSPLSQQPPSKRARVEIASSPESSDDSTPPPRIVNKIYLSDSKTRGVPTLPSHNNSLQSRLQLMLYKRLFDALLRSAYPSSGGPDDDGELDEAGLPRFSFTQWCMHSRANPYAKFSKPFIQQIKQVLDTPKLNNLEELTAAWCEAVRELNVEGGLEDELSLVYRLRSGRSWGSRGRRMPDDESVGEGKRGVERGGEGAEGGMVKRGRRGLKRVLSRRERVEKALKQLEEDQVAWAIRQSLKEEASSESGGSSLGSSQSSSFTSAAGGAVALDGGRDSALASELGPGAASDETQVLTIIPAILADLQTNEENPVEWVIRENLRTISTSDGTASPSSSISTSVSSSPGPSKATEETGSTSPSSVDTGSPPRHLVPEVLVSDSDTDMEGGIIGVEKFAYDAEKLDAHLVDILDFWLGRREPRGVADENATRCHTCEFNDGCEWREAKAHEATMRYRSYAASDGSSNSIRKHDLALTSW
ncbi:hypothetical protein BOTBODRAFT_53047 [Botryobasidium botryosum FD-172 SS1]|uniref:Exonuclease V n=1 Tax=Botryobasidium botryosum (strain FD-172 SS1) TaxID=930990 RepID=A0A067MU99_BOTB1|nr:hypothetical protein BOTBODRAFT_53047 [Botryobasidium botryosum FD-172 SS1]